MVSGAGCRLPVPDWPNAASDVMPAEAGMDCVNHWIPRPPVPDLPAAGRRGFTARCHCGESRNPRFKITD